MDEPVESSDGGNEPLGDSETGRRQIQPRRSGNQGEDDNFSGTQYNQATTAVSYNSSSDKRVHFGLGAAELVDAIELTWPSGTKQVLKNVKADQMLTVTESAK